LVTIRGSVNRLNLFCFISGDRHGRLHRGAVKVYAAEGAVETVEGVVTEGLALFDKKSYTQAIEAFKRAEGVCNI
jgi:hypothetical protein